MDNLNLNTLITENIVPTHIFEALPKEITIKILGYLERKNLFAACSSCKLLNEIADSSPLWKEEIQLFKIDVKEHIEKNTSIRVTAGKCIIPLQICSKQADELSNKKHNTKLNFMEFCILKSNSSKKFNKKIEKICTETKIIYEGFKAALQLKKIGLKNIDILEKYATTLLVNYENSYGNGEEAWKIIVIEHLSENNPERALTIIDNELNGRRLKSSTLKEIVMYYSGKNLINEAIEVVKRYKEIDQHFKDFYLSDCNTTMISWAEKFENSLAIEKIIDICLFEEEKFKTVKNLIENTLNMKKFKEADRLFLKYTHVISSCKYRDLNDAIFLSVRLGDIDLAWEIALKNQKNLALFYSLKEAFSFFHLTEEKEKAQKMIDENK